MSKPLAIVTGASSGSGLELAAVCAQEGLDLLVAADRPEIHAAADRFRQLGAQTTVVKPTSQRSRALSSCGRRQPADTSMRSSSTRPNGFLRASRHARPPRCRSPAQPDFWFESFQNWQSELLAIARWCGWRCTRQRWSPESIPVHAPHDETGH